MKKCYCGLPETYETIVIPEDNSGCNICKKKVQKSNIDYSIRLKKLKEFLKKTRNNKMLYDCVIPFSGGKDSTFQLYYIVNELKLKPLVVQFNHGFFRENLNNNNEKTLKKLGVDFISFTPNWKLVKKLMRVSFERKGDFCWHCHTGIFAYPMQIAVKFKIPLLIWGESNAEYTGYYDFDPEKISEQDEEAFNRYINLGITSEDMFGFLKDKNLDQRDLHPYKYPNLRDLKKIGYKSLQYGNFVKWDPVKQTEIIKRELGWKEDEVEGLPEDFWMEKLECRLNGVRDWLKYIKRGFGRTAQSVAREIRLGNMTKEEGKVLVQQYNAKKPQSLKYFLKIMNLTEDAFMKIVLKHEISPWKYDEKLVSDGKKLHDQDSWEDTPLR